MKGQNIGASTKNFYKQIFDFDTLDSMKWKYMSFGSFKSYAYCSVAKNGSVWSIKIKACFSKSSDFSKFMQTFFLKIILDYFFYQKALILTALDSKITKIHPNWKIALILVACCQ